MNYRKKIKEYLIRSSLEKKSDGTPVNLFPHDKFDQVLFSNESYVMRFDDDKLWRINRNSINKSEYLTEEEFFAYLDICIEMDLNRLKNIVLRKKLIHKDEFKKHMRSIKIDKIL